ncbi:uncharacterized protein LOC142355367 [Convolutriloba macropyga]|uniref:uncharacterized protein LOC142355367 n=1 Tax=Convolutriloba macropyga TaxID=536237 RepID=UPI003F51F09B
MSSCLVGAPPAATVSVVSLSATEISLSLQTGASLYDSVQLQMSGEDGFSSNQIFSSPYQSTTWNTLTPNTAYIITVTLSIVRPTSPSNVRFSFVTSSVCRVQWTANPYFISSAPEDGYNIFLNGQLATKTAADKQDLSVTLSNLDLCASYNVTIQPSSGDENFDATSMQLRNYECDICPSDNLADMCSFPFNFGGEVYSKCALKPIGPADLFCLNSNGQSIECNEKGRLLLHTILHFVQPISHNENFLNTTNKFHFLNNLTTGTLYEFKVVIESFGRIGESQFVVFQATDKSSNAFAYNPTSSAVKLSWDSFLSDDKRRRLRRSASEVIEAINIEATFEVSDLMSSLFTAEELSSMIYNETIPLGTSAELQNLTSGLRYKIVVTAINGLGEKMENKSLTTEAVTVPNDLTETGNNISVIDEPTNGLVITFQLTQYTTAEVFNVFIHQITTSLKITQDGLGGATIIISREETITKVDLTCLATNASCIDPSTWEFLGVAFGDQGLLPGARYLANIHSSTGPTESQETVIQNIQKPLPVENLVCVEFYEDVLKLEWSPPRTGSVIGFHVTLEHPDGTNTSHPVNDIVGFTATELFPGSTYKFYVSSYADKEGLIRSEPVVLVQGTTPKEPSKVEATALVGSDGRSFTISAAPPVEGAYKFFRIVAIQDNSASNFIQTGNESSEASEVFQNGSLFTFPIGFPVNSTDTTIHMAKFGNVYSIKVGAVSDFGLPSLSSPNTYVFTEMKSIEQEPLLILNSDNNLCLIWETDSTVNHFDSLKVVGLQHSRKVVEFIYPVDNQQDSGLVCIDKKLTRIGRSDLTVELTTTTDDYLSGLTERSQKTSYIYSLTTEVQYAINITLQECEGRRCHLEVSSEMLGSSSQLAIEYQITLNGEQLNGDKLTEKGCGIEMNRMKCQFELTNLDESREYYITVTASVLGQILPTENSLTIEPRTTVSDNEEETGEESGSSSVWIYVGIGLGVGIVFLIASIVVVKHVKKAIEKRMNRTESAEEDSVYMNPIRIPDPRNRTMTSTTEYINKMVGGQRRPIDEESAIDYLRQQATWNGNSAGLNRHLMATSFVNQMQRHQSVEYAVPRLPEDLTDYQLPNIIENEYVTNRSISSITILDD